MPRRSKRIEANFTQNPERDPQSFKEAMLSADKDEWMTAMLDELRSLETTGTYELTDLPKDRKTIGCKWVFERKKEHDNIRFKARLGAQGFSQKYGEDYDEVFAPVARAPTIRLLLSFAGIRQFLVKQFDVKTAFLNGSLKEEIYMRQPPGFKQGEKVFRLRKSLYGLKQAARSWHIMLNESLKRNGFSQSQADDCLFMKHKENDICYLVVHVDDMLCVGSTPEIIDEVFASLSQHFELKDLGFPKQFLGIDIFKSPEGFFQH